MSEQASDEFKPLLPIYGAYPIPAVLRSNDYCKIAGPIELLLGSEGVIDQIVRASVDKPADDPLSPRMENHIPLMTPHGVLIERSSHEYKIRGNPEVSREIVDVVEFGCLGGKNAVFDWARLSVRKTEFRGGKDFDREIETDSWYVYFYKPGEDQPTAEVYRTSNISDSYIEVDKVRYRLGLSETDGSALMKPLDSLTKDHPEILGQLATTIEEMQFAVLEPMLPALDNREAVMRRGANRSFRDPHTRHIGLLARLGDRIMETRDR